MLQVSIGKVGIFDDVDDPYLVGLEYQFRPVGTWQLISALGVAAAQNDAGFFYFDLRRNFWVSERWVLTPSFGAGFFDDGDDVELGNILEFRSGIYMAYRFDEQSRVGLALFHLSNGGLADKNPGTEVLLFSLSVPFQAD